MNQKTVLIVLLCLVAALAIISGISLTVAIQQGRKLKEQSFEITATKAAEKAWKDKYDQIQKTPAADLVAQSPNASELVGARDKLVNEAAARVTDAIRLHSRPVVPGGSGGSIRWYGH
jgi:predicted PurR-regulated permease PerM